MNLNYLLPPLIASTIGLILLFLLLIKGQRRPEHNIFSFIIFTTILWGLLTFLMRASPDVEQALLWDKAIMPIVFTSFVLYYHFSLVLTGTPGRKILIACYTILTLAFVFHRTDFFIQSMHVQSYGYAPTLGIGVYMLFPVGYFLVTLAIYNLYRRYRASALYEERNRLFYLIIAMTVPLLGVTLDAFPFVYPAGIFGNIVFCLFASVAILKYHLLDIHVVIRKGLAYLLISSMVALPYVGLIILFGQLFTKTIPGWVYVLLLLLLALGLQPLWGWVQRVVDRLFYRERYDYLKALEQFGQQIKDITDFDHLAFSLTELISQAMQLSSVCLIMPSLQTDDYRVAASKGLKGSSTQCKLHSDSPFIKWMERTSDFLQSREIDFIPQLRALSHSEREVLSELQGELYIPLNVRGKLAGILVLGRKLSEQSFTMEDLHLLSAVSTQMAVSLENARLYQAEKQRAGELAVLQQSSARLATELDLDLLWQKVVEEAARLLQTDAAALFIMEEKSQSLILKAATGLAVGYFERLKIPLVSVIPQDSLDDFKQGSAVVVISDVKKSPIKELAFIAREDIRSILTIPLVQSGQLVNVIAIFSKHIPRWFTEEEINMAQAFTRHAALAMENARLYGVERKQRLELEKLDEMRADFFIAISHELRTPLTSIRSAGEMILDGAELDPNSPKSKLVSIINRNAERMGKRIQELLDFVKIQSAALELEREAEDISLAIEEATSLSLPALWSRKQTLKIRSLDSVTMVMLDHNRFEQIVGNLLSNASKYSPQGSEILVEARVEDSKVIIDVSDRGPGVPPEYQERIFEPYFRGDENSTAGLGIGLNIAKALTELHGGQLWVSDRDGGGSVFSFSLPIEHSPRTSHKSRERTANYQPLSS